MAICLGAVFVCLFFVFQLKVFAMPVKADLELPGFASPCWLILFAVEVIRIT